MHNSMWTFDNTDDDFYILTTTEAIVGEGHKSFGLRGGLPLLDIMRSDEQDDPTVYGKK